MIKLLPYALNLERHRNFARAAALTHRSDPQAGRWADRKVVGLIGRPGETRPGPGNPECPIALGGRTLSGAGCNYDPNMREQSEQ